MHHAQHLEWGYIPHPRHPLRPCCKHGGAPGTRESPSPILVLLSPRSKRLERSILRHMLLLFNTTRAHSPDPQARGPQSLFMLLLFNTTRRALFMDEYCECEKVSS